MQQSESQIAASRAASTGRTAAPGLQPHGHNGHAGQFTYKHHGQANVYRALAEHAKRQAHPEAIEQAHTDFAAHEAAT